MVNLGKKSFIGVTEIVSGVLVIALSALGLATLADHFEKNVTKHALLADATGQVGPKNQGTQTGPNQKSKRSISTSGTLSV